MNRQQLVKWVPDDFEGAIHIPAFRLGKDLQLRLSTEDYMPLAATCGDVLD